MPYSKERDRNRKWWERYLSRMPWWENVGMEGSEEEMEAAREVYRRELGGWVPPLEERTLRRYRHTYERHR